MTEQTPKTDIWVEQLNAKIEDIMTELQNLSQQLKLRDATVAPFQCMACGALHFAMSEFERLMKPGSEEVDAYRCKACGAECFPRDDQLPTRL